MAYNVFTNGTQTTLQTILNAGDLTMTPANYGIFPNNNQLYVSVESEIILITDLSIHPYPIQRGQSQTIAATHAAGIAVQTIVTAESLQTAYFSFPTVRDLWVLGTIWNSPAIDNPHIGGTIYGGPTIPNPSFTGNIKGAGSYLDVTLIRPHASTIINTGTLTLPLGTDAIVANQYPALLQNKTFPDLSLKPRWINTPYLNSGAVVPVTVVYNSNLAVLTRITATPLATPLPVDGPNYAIVLITARVGFSNIVNPTPNQSTLNLYIYSDVSFNETSHTEGARYVYIPDHGKPSSVHMSMIGVVPVSGGRRGFSLFAQWQSGINSPAAVSDQNILATELVAVQIGSL